MFVNIKLQQITQKTHQIISVFYSKIQIVTNEFENGKLKIKNQMDVNQIFFIGHNKYGQAGIGQQQHNRKYTQPKSIVFKTFIKQITCGNHHSALLTIDGYIYTMGSNIHGTLGLTNGDNINYSFRPTLVKQLKDVDQIYSGSYHMCALKQGELYTWGKGLDGQLGHSNMKNLFIPTKVVSLGNNVEKVNCGTNHTLVLINKQKSQYNGYSFGNGIYGQLGNGTNKNYNYPINIKLENIQQICAGENHSLFIVDNKVYGCGDNTNNQVGNVGFDNGRNKKYILQPQKLDLPENITISLLSAHVNSAVLTQQGQTYVWGGKQKIWPATKLNQKNIINLKVKNQKVYYLTQQNQIKSISITPNNKSATSQTQTQTLIQNSNVLDFDVGQNHLLAIGDIIAQTQYKQQPDILSIWSGESLQSSKSQFSQKNIQAASSKNIHIASNEYSSIDNGNSKQNNNNIYQQQQNEQIINFKDRMQKNKMSDYFITKHLNSGKSSMNKLYEQKMVISRRANNNLGLQSLSQNQQISSSHQSHTIQQDLYQTNTFNDYTPQQNSQQCSNTNSNQSQKENLIEYSNQQQIYYCTNKGSQNISSEIEIQQRYSYDIQDLMTKRQMEDHKFKMKNNNGFLSTKDCNLENGDSKQSLENVEEKRSDHNQQTKLYKLMEEMEEKTAHLKKKNYKGQEKASFIDFEEKSIRLQNKQKKIMKTPSSYIKKQPQRFILESQQLVKCNSFVLDPSIKIQNFSYQNTKQDTSRSPLPLKQILFDNNNFSHKQSERIKNYKRPLEMKTKSIIYYNENYQKQSQERNLNLSKNESKKSFKSNNSKINQAKKQNQSIETIFKKLLRKHHKQKYSEVSIKQQPIPITLEINHKRYAQNQTQKTQLTSVEKYRNLSQSGISSKMTEISTSRLQKQSIQTAQIFSKNSFSQIKIKKSPLKQQAKLSSSKLSSHSNKSCVLTGGNSQNRKNQDMLDISRSNRGLRGELRERDLKISQLQEDLSRKQMEIFKLKKILKKNGIKYQY